MSPHMSRKAVVAALAVLAGLLLPQYVHGGMLVGIFDGVLYDVDRETGTVSNGRDTGNIFLQSLAASPTGELFGSDRASLFLIDLSSGDTEQITPLASQVQRDFGIDPTSGWIFASGRRTGGGSAFNSLFQISPETGEHTLVSDGFPVGAIAFDPNGQLYHLERDVLRLINKTNGDTISGFVFDFRFNTHASTAIDDDGLLWIANFGDSPPTLFSVDLLTGEYSPAATLDVPIYGLAFIPEPATAVLLGLGAVGLLVGKWRSPR